MKGFGCHAEDFTMSGFDLRDAQVGRSVAYEFDIEIDNKVVPFKLLEDGSVPVGWSNGTMDSG